MIHRVPNLSIYFCETDRVACPPDPFGLALLDTGLFETVRQSLRSVTRLSSCWLVLLSGIMLRKRTWELSSQSYLCS